MLKVSFVNLFAVVNLLSALIQANIKVFLSRIFAKYVYCDIFSYFVINDLDQHFIMRTNILLAALRVAIYTSNAKDERSQIIKVINQANISNVFLLFSLVSSDDTGFD